MTSSLIGDHCEMLGREGAAFANVVFDRIDQRRADRAAAAQAERAKFQIGAAGWQAWDAAAKHYAVRDALLSELRRLDPTNPLLKKEVQQAVGKAGVAAFVRQGRKDVADAAVISTGAMRIR